MTVRRVCEKRYINVSDTFTNAKSEDVTPEAHFTVAEYAREREIRLGELKLSEQKI